MYVMSQRCRGHEAYNYYDSLRASIIGRMANCRRCGGLLVSLLDVEQGNPGLNPRLKQVRVVRKVDNAIHRIPHYPMDSVV